MSLGRRGRPGAARAHCGCRRVGPPVAQSNSLPQGDDFRIGDRLVDSHEPVHQGAALAAHLRRGSRLHSLAYLAAASAAALPSQNPMRLRNLPRQMGRRRTSGGMGLQRSPWGPLINGPATPASKATTPFATYSESVITKRGGRSAKAAQSTA